MEEASPEPAQNMRKRMPADVRNRSFIISQGGAVISMGGGGVRNLEDAVFIVVFF